MKHRWSSSTFRVTRDSCCSQWVTNSPMPLRGKTIRSTSTGSRSGATSTLATERGQNVEPCLLADEAQAISVWLLRVSTQSPAPVPVLEDGDVNSGDAMTFLEPNLAFSVVGYPSPTSAVVRVHVSFVSLDPDYFGARRDGIYCSHIDIEIEQDAIVHASEALSAELRDYPER